MVTMTSRESHSGYRRQALALQFCLAVAILLFVTPARAHGLEAGTGAARITDERVSIVAAFPVSAFIRFDDDRDGGLSREEVQHHRSQLRDDFMRQAQVEIVGNDAQLVLGFFDVGVPSNLHSGHIPYIRFNAAFEGPIDDNGIRLRFDFSYADALRFRVIDERSPQRTPVHLALPATAWSPILGSSEGMKPNEIAAASNISVSWPRLMGFVFLVGLGGFFVLRVSRRKAAPSET